MSLLWLSDTLSKIHSHIWNGRMVIDCGDCGAIVLKHNLKGEVEWMIPRALNYLTPWNILQEQKSCL